MNAALLIPWLPVLAALTIVGIASSKLGGAFNRLAPAICAGSIGAGFLITLLLWPQLGHGAESVQAYEWLRVGDFSAGMSYFLDPLTMVMLAVVTGIGGLIAVYAAGYMKGDPGQ